MTRRDYDVEGSRRKERFEERVVFVHDTRGYSPSSKTTAPIGCFKVGAVAEIPVGLGFRRVLTYPRARSHARDENIRLGSRATIGRPRVSILTSCCKKGRALAFLDYYCCDHVVSKQGKPSSYLLDAVAVGRSAENLKPFGKS